MFPKDVRYTQTHEWVRLEGNVATIGITKYAVDQLSDLTYVELPVAGDELTAEMALGAIESVKAAVDLICPIDGKVLDVNKAVIENPDIISEDPYDDGWLVTISPTDASQIDELMTAEAYQEFVLVEAGDEEEEEEEEEVEEDDGVTALVPKKLGLDLDVDILADVDDEDEEGKGTGGADEKDDDEEEEEEEDELL